MSQVENIVLVSPSGEQIALPKVLEVLNSFLLRYYQENFPGLFQADLHHVLSAEPGKKYIRVVSASSSGNHRSSYCFLDYQGNIYKCASWKAPAKHIRGTVFDKDCSYGNGLGAYGAKYL